MRTIKKHRVPLTQMIRLGTFLSAVFLGVDGTSATTLVREIGVTTYLRDGPGLRYRAVDEAQMGTSVSVIGCANGWCDVLDGNVSGYVAQSTLAISTNQTSRTQNHACVVGEQASYHGNREVLFCRSGIPPNGKPASNP